MTIQEAVAKFKQRVESSPNYPAMLEMVKKLKEESETRKAPAVTEKHAE